MLRTANEATNQLTARPTIRAVKDGTARNLNTIAKLAQIAADLTR